MFNLETLIADGLAIEVIPGVLYFASTAARPPPANTGSAAATAAAATAVSGGGSGGGNDTDNKNNGIVDNKGDGDSKRPSEQQPQYGSNISNVKPAQREEFSRPQTAKSALEQAGWEALTGSAASRPQTALFNRFIPVHYPDSHTSAGGGARGRRLNEVGGDGGGRREENDKTAAGMDPQLERELREALTADNGNGGGCAAQADGFYFTVAGDSDFVYHPFFADFGPLDLGCMVRFSRRLARLLGVTAGYAWEKEEPPGQAAAVGDGGGASRPSTALKSRPGTAATAVGSRPTTSGKRAASASGARVGGGLGGSASAPPEQQQQQQQLSSEGSLGPEPERYVLRPPADDGGDAPPGMEFPSSSPARPRAPLVFCTSMKAHERTNAATLVGAFCVCALGWDAGRVQDAFVRKCFPPLMPYRDASSGASNYPLSVMDVLRGLQRAVGLHWLDVRTFDLAGYEHAKTAWDYTWIVPGKMLAFSSPEDSNPRRTARRYAELFRALDVRRVIKLNERLYDPEAFVRRGVRHTDLEYPDGSAPLDNVLKTFLRVVEEQYGERAPAGRPVVAGSGAAAASAGGLSSSSAAATTAASSSPSPGGSGASAGGRGARGGTAGGRRRGLPPAVTTPVWELHHTADRRVVSRNPLLCGNGGAVAVHCRAGLGRTGTLVCAYAMRHYRLTAREALGWVRVCRPGSVTGIQQQYLDTLERRMTQPAPEEEDAMVTDIARTVTGEFALAYQPHGAVGKDAFKPRDRSLTAKAAGGGAGKGECSSPTRRARARSSVTGGAALVGGGAAERLSTGGDSVTSMLGGGTFSNSIYGFGGGLDSPSAADAHAYAFYDGLATPTVAASATRARGSVIGAGSGGRDSPAFHPLGLDGDGNNTAVATGSSSGGGGNGNGTGARAAGAFDRTYHSAPRRLSAIFAERTTALQRASGGGGGGVGASPGGARGGGGGGGGGGSSAGSQYAHTRTSSAIATGSNAGGGGGGTRPSSSKGAGVKPLTLLDSQDIVPPPDAGGALTYFTVRRFSGASDVSTQRPGSPNTLSANLWGGVTADWGGGGSRRASAAGLSGGLDVGEDAYPPSHYFLALEEQQMVSPMHQRRPGAARRGQQQQQQQQGQSRPGSPVTFAPNGSNGRRLSLSSAQLGNSAGGDSTVFAFPGTGGGGSAAAAEASSGAGSKSRRVGGRSPEVMAVTPSARRNTGGMAPLAAARHGGGLIPRYQAARTREREDSVGHAEGSAAAAAAGAATAAGGGGGGGVDLGSGYSNSLTAAGGANRELGSTSFALNSVGGGGLPPRHNGGANGNGNINGADVNGSFHNGSLAGLGGGNFLFATTPAGGGGGVGGGSQMRLLPAPTARTAAAAAAGTPRSASVANLSHLATVPGSGSLTGSAFNVSGGGGILYGDGYAGAAANNTNSSGGGVGPGGYSYYTPPAGAGAGPGSNKNNLFVHSQFVRNKTTNAAWGAPVLKLGQPV